MAKSQCSGVARGVRSKREARKGSLSFGDIPGGDQNRPIWLCFVPPPGMAKGPLVRCGETPSQSGCSTHSNYATTPVTVEDTTRIEVNLKHSGSVHIKIICAIKCFTL